MPPVMELLAGQFTNQIRFVKMNVEETQGLAERYRVDGLPTFLFFKGGTVVDGFTGEASVEEVDARLRVLAGAHHSAAPKSTAQN